MQGFGVLCLVLGHFKTCAQTMVDDWHTNRTTVARIVTNLEPYCGKVNFLSYSQFFFISF